MTDVEILISAIQERPVLWDKRNKRYHNRLLSLLEWEKVARIIGSTSLQTSGKTTEIADFEILKEKANCADIAKKKWKNLRDSFAKEYKKKTMTQSGADAESQPEYNGTWPFFESMLFLKEVVNHRKPKVNTHESLPTVLENVESDTTDVSESMMTSNIIPENQLDETTTQNLCSENTQSYDNEVSLPSTSRLISTPVRQNRTNERKKSLQNRKRRDVLDCLAIEKEKVQLFHTDQMDADNEDLYWFKTILPHIKQLPPLHRLRFRTLMQQLLLTELTKINTPEISYSQIDYNEQ